MPRMRELFHCPGDLAAVLFQEGGGHTADRFGFVAIEAGGLNRLLDFFLRRLGEILRCFVLFKQLRSHLVHALVGALRGKNRSDKKLQRRFEIQLAMRVGINFLKRCDQLLNAFASRHVRRLLVRRSSARWIERSALDLD